MPTLLDISDELQDMEDQIEAVGGDIEAAGTLVDDWLQACERRREKLDGYAALIRDMELRAEARKSEARRLADRAKRDEEQVAFLKERLRQHFIRHDLKTVETRRFRITHARNGGLVPLILDCDAEALPEDFRLLETRCKANVEAIRNILDSGEHLTFARYGERGSSIRIS